MQLNLNPEQGRMGEREMIVWFGSRASVFFHYGRFGVTRTSAGSSRSSMENGRREREKGAESDEEDNDEHQQNTSDGGTEKRPVGQTGTLGGE